MQIEPQFDVVLESLTDGVANFGIMVGSGHVILEAQDAPKSNTTFRLHIGSPSGPAMFQFLL